MATKLGIYNDALIRVGEDILDTITDDRDSRYALDTVYDTGAVRYCLKRVRPRFAVKTALLTQSASSTAHTYSYALPSDFIDIVGVFADKDLTQPVTRYVQDGSAILTDSATVYLRYVWTNSTEANFSEEFARVVSYYLARETCYKFDPDRYSSLNDAFNDAVSELSDQESIKDPAIRPAASGSALTDAWRAIYNDALLIIGQDKLPAGNSDHINRVRLDTAVDAGVVSEVLEDTEWKFGVTSAKLEYDPNVSPAWGHQYAHQKPSDLHRLSGLFQDEFFQVPLKYYEDEGDYFFCGNDTIYIKYVSTTWLTQPSAWPSYFSRLVAARMALNSAPVIDKQMIDHATNIYVRRKNSAMSNDAIQSPPQVIRSGNWTNSRWSNTRDRNRP